MIEEKISNKLGNSMDFSDILTPDFSDVPDEDDLISDVPIG